MASRFISKLKKGISNKYYINGGSKYNGYCILNGSIMARYNVLKEEYPFALLYFTSLGISIKKWGNAF